MEIKEIKNKEIWENFLAGCREKTFLQSWNWGEFNQKMGHKIWRLGIFDKDDLVGTVLAVKIKARRGTFLLIQHGPNIKSKIKSRVRMDEAGDECEAFSGHKKSKILEIILDKLKEIGKKEKADFIRISPLSERNDENEEIFKELGFREAPMHANAYEATWKLDIGLPEEKLLKDMRKTTRYLIRQAQKNKDIEIFQRWSANDVEAFNKIHQEVVRVQKFTPFSLEYFKNEFLIFQKDDQLKLFFGKYKGETVASAFVLFWSKIGFYHHAALLPQHHKAPVSYLLLWEAIKEAKKRGCLLFDFWGFVDPRKQPNHPWAGPTFFKMGFGGRPYEYVRTKDFPLSKKYWLTFIFEKLRKIRRRL